MNPSKRLTLEGVANAVHAVPRAYRDTPCVEVASCSAALGATTFVKVESLNPVRSFKGRGAYTFVARDGAGADAGDALVCASAGNFGLAMAHACRDAGRSLIVFAARDANPLKVAAIRASGTEVVLDGADFDAAKDAARRHAARTGARFVEDGREAAIAEGAGTIALECLRDGALDVDAVLVPLGNGALLAGIATVVRAVRPSVQIVAVVAAGAPAMAASLDAGTVVTTASVDTIADGVAVRVPVPEALSDLVGLVDDVVRVEDDVIVHAMRHLHQHMGLVIEPAGALGVAALLAGRERFAGGRVTTVACGGNVTDEQRRAWIC